MKIAYHGGYCCGIKTIHGFPLSPSCILGELQTEWSEADKPLVRNRDRAGLWTDSRMNFYPYSLPEETARERLVRYVEFLKETRPSGIVEAILARSNASRRHTNGNYYSELSPKFASAAGASYYSTDQVSVWGPVLRELGFRLVNSCRNSNSTNRVFVFHLNLGDDDLGKGDLDGIV